MASLNINAQNVEVDVAPDTPLLWVLRENLKLKGTKFGCGAALCGACTIHIDGVAARACITPVAAASGKRIRTIEGVGDTKEGKATQQAWLQIDVPQCGYCQPGQIMAAAALLSQRRLPSDADIDAAMSGILCRCGTYQRIRTAIKAAAQSLA